MGLEIDRDQFEDREFDAFAHRLRACLAALHETLARPGFGVGPTTIGAELEVDIVDDAFRPLPINRRVLRDALDPNVTLEMGRFNLEINTCPVALAGRPFSSLSAELERSLAAIRAAAARHGGDVTTIGILPTITSDDLGRGALTNAHRYRALSSGIRRARKEQPFRVDISGEDRLAFEVDDCALEGANTSFQVHLRVAPADFARVYNAAQLATALFRQAVDDRAVDEHWRPARVSFGHGWVRSGAAEPFEESVALHEPIIPIVSDEDPIGCVRKGGVPRLSELRLHMGTVWRWNRAVYDHADGGHLRIELRAMPSGPTVRDMAANAALHLGLTLALAARIDRLVERLPFELARFNFCEAARRGLDATLFWPAEAAPSPRTVRAADLVRALVPEAQAALVAAGVDSDEAASLLAIIDARAASGSSAARWQRRALAARGGDASKPAVVSALMADYQALSRAGAPVHTWPVDERVAAPVDVG
jgi:gamma-glutamyl:cysteine ligase YbdK (ATP-grasp superfamily)